MIITRYSILNYIYWIIFLQEHISTVNVLKSKKIYTTHGVSMVFSTVRRQLLLGVMAVALTTGLNVKTYAADNLLDQVKLHGELKVGLEGTYPPFSFQDADGKLAGFEVDFANALAKHLGVKADLKPTKWDGMLASLDSKRIDVVINQVTISDERKKKYDFSTPYTVSGIQVLVKKGNEGSITKPDDLKGKKVGVGLGTNYEQWLRENVQGVDVRTYDDDPTKYQDLRVGRINAILVDRLAALDMVKKTGDTLAVAGPTFSRQESGVAVRKNNPELLAAINTAIAQMEKDGTLSKISEKWFGEDITK
jgi:cystine transport system substrate-binding protein